MVGKFVSWWASRPPKVGAFFRAKPVQLVLGPGLLLIAAFTPTTWLAILLAAIGFVLVQGSAIAANSRASRAEAAHELQVMLQQIVLVLESHHPEI